MSLSDMQAYMNLKLIAIEALNSQVTKEDPSKKTLPDKALERIVHLILRP